MIGHGAFRKRITEMGFVKGKCVKVIKNAPLQDPIEYEIMDSHVSLRRNEARLIEVVSTDNSNPIHDSLFNGTITDDTISKIVAEKAVQ